MRFLLIMLLMLADTSVHGIEMGKNWERHDAPQLEPPSPPSATVDVRSALKNLCEDRPTIGIGPLNVMLFVDFNEPSSLLMLRHLIEIAKKEHSLRITIVYYAPALPMREQTAAVFSSIVFQAVNRKQHLRYLENLVLIHGRSRNALTSSTRAAHIDLKKLLAMSKTLEPKAQAIIKQNNEAGYLLTHINRAPIMVVEGKIIAGYLPRKSIVPLLNRIVLEGRQHQSRIAQ